MLASLATINLLTPLIAAMALGAACAVLSVVVVLRRWAFIGEGISHSGFAGAGTIWLAALLFPNLEHPAITYAAIVLACLITAILIGYFSRTGRLNADAAIGIFLVASVAWGFLAHSVYMRVRHAAPAGWDTFLLGDLFTLTTPYAVIATILSIAVIAMVALLNKEILLYCLDPVAAEVSGVPAGVIHYLLMTLVAIMIILGIRLAGPLLVTAFLVLPGATALMISSKLRDVFAISVGAGLISCIVGVILNNRFPSIPSGPVIVLLMFAQFLIAYASKAVRSRSSITSP